jgi:hypothetical protein
MLKRILYWVMVIVIVGGAVYSYNKLGFGRKTAMLFQVAFGDAANMGGPGGGPGGQAPGARPEGGPGQIAPGEGGFQGGQQGQENVQGQRPNFKPGNEAGGRPPQGPGRGSGPGGGIISVRNVIPYTFILAFFALITCVIEKSIRRFPSKA